MSKYILKKDLPFAKAGSEIVKETNILDQSLADRFVVKVDKSDYHSNTEAYSFRFIGYVKDADYLIQEGWIEEVKEIPHEQKCEEGISILEIIRNAVHHARMNRRIVDKAYLSPRLYRSFRDELQTEFDCFPPTKSGDKFEGVYVERKNDEPYISFTYKEPKSDKKPREFNILLDPDGVVKAISMIGKETWDFYLEEVFNIKEVVKVREVME
ncbi:MAG: hypothetical protein PHS93_08980 [Candidatus Omnitrophica bacterium]|jgi:hypothetical protein|nr:hypothetical protein [Candidatus Omnitrophota bacterium]